MPLTTIPAATNATPKSTGVATVVLQSHRLPMPHYWLEAARDSVRDWAELNGYGYRFIDDILFDELTATERGQCANQPVVASDLARLRWCQRLLREGAQRVVWCDADTLIFDPKTLMLSEAPCAFGRELWLQADSGSGAKLKLYKKIHNAFMQFSVDDPVLDFYSYAAARLIANHTKHSAGPMVAQLAGPKFLTHLHNVLSFDVLETAQVMSPILGDALLSRDPKVLAHYSHATVQPPAALNLCCSEVQRGALSDAQMQALIELLMTHGASAFGSG